MNIIVEIHTDFGNWAIHKIPGKWEGYQVYEDHNGTWSFTGKYPMTLETAMGYIGSVLERRVLHGVRTDSDSESRTTEPKYAMARHRRERKVD